MTRNNCNCLRALALHIITYVEDVRERKEIAVAHYQLFFHL